MSDAESANPPTVVLPTCTVQHDAVANFYRVAIQYPDEMVATVVVELHAPAIDHDAAHPETTQRLANLIAMALAFGDGGCAAHGVVYTALQQRRQ